MYKINILISSPQEKEGIAVNKFHLYCPNKQVSLIFYSSLQSHLESYVILHIVDNFTYQRIKFHV